MKDQCKNYGLLTHKCNKCTTKLENSKIDNDILIKDCFKQK